MPLHPPLLDRVLDYALGGAPRIETVRLRQKGTIRLDPEGAWMPFTARQTVEAGRVAFTWDARVRMRAWIRASVRDAFDGTRGRLRARLFGVIPVAHARGIDVDRGEVLRYLAELPWCPWAYRQNEDLFWSQGDDATLRVRTNVTTPPCEVAFEIAEDGRVLTMSGHRPREEEDGAVEHPWGAAFTEWTEHEGIRYPAQGEVWWDLPAGRFPYWRGTVTALETR